MLSLQVTMDTGVEWGLEVTGILGVPLRQVIVLPTCILNLEIFREACFSVGSWLLHRGG